MAWVSPSRARSAGLNTFISSPPELDLSGLSRAMASVNAAETALKNVKEAIIKYAEDAKRVLPASWSVVASSVTGLDSFVQTAALAPAPLAATQAVIQPQPKPMPKRKKKPKPIQDAHRPPTEQEKKERRLARNARRSERKRQKRLEAGPPAPPNVRIKVEQHPLPTFDSGRSRYGTAVNTVPLSYNRITGQTGSGEAVLPEIKQESSNDGHLVPPPGHPVTENAPVVDRAWKIAESCTSRSEMPTASSTSGMGTLFASSHAFEPVPYQQRLQGAGSGSNFYNQPATSGVSPQVVLQSKYKVDHNMHPATFGIPLQAVQSRFNHYPNMHLQSSTALAHYASVGPNFIYAGKEWDRDDTINTDSAIDDHDIHSVTDTDQNMSEAGDQDVDNFAERARPIEHTILDSLEQQTRDKVMRLQQIFPSVTIVTAQIALLLCNGNMNDAAGRLRAGGAQEISDGEPESANSEDIDLPTINEDPLEDGEILEENIQAPGAAQPTFRLVDTALALAAAGEDVSMDDSIFTRTRSTNSAIATSADGNEPSTPCARPPVFHFERKPLTPIQQQNIQQKSNVGYKDGDRVGAATPELDFNNKGRLMLVKMGWATGTGLGASPNKGILSPLAPVIKTSKSGYVKL